MTSAPPVLLSEQKGYGGKKVDSDALKEGLEQGTAGFQKTYDDHSCTAAAGTYRLLHRMITHHGIHSSLL